MARLPFLGNLTPEKFLREYWQKKPLYVPRAFPGFRGLLSPDELAGLACEDEPRSRLVTLEEGQFKLDEGPFPESRFTALPERDWTLLVQGINHYLRSGERLLSLFNFIPHARLDDLMVSYAVPGGSVGPHFDSYDVFLIQGRGHRRWQISSQRDLELIPDVPLRILKRFKADKEWVVGPGDLLYLPPRYAHYGLALDECMTYSIGFRAPTAQEFCSQFCAFLSDQVRADGLYEDPDLRPAKHPSSIDDTMVQKVERMLANVHWDRELVARFLGEYLSAPKPHLVFEQPKRPLSLAAFARRAEQKGIRLALESQMLSRGRRFFLNGEVFDSERANQPLLLRLADERALPPGSRLTGSLLSRLHDWYKLGFLSPA